MEGIGMRLLKAGSVKRVYVIREPQEGVGEGRFLFTDSYSVFDWGEMPQVIPYKGAALSIIGAFFFEKLQSLGIRTHYLGVEEEGKVKRLDELKAPSSVMAVKLVRIIEPALKDDRYDYSVFKDLKGNFLIPLEFIYRNSLPEGSSVFRRLKEGSLKLSDLGLERMPQVGEKLERPILDFSTKLEKTDRYLTEREAKELAFLKDQEFEEMKKIVLRINDLINEVLSPHNLENEDGKVELAFDPDRKPMVVDVVGTPDESRFTFEGIPLSKEVLRILYRKTKWYEEVERAKREDPINWKQRVSSPPPLPEKAIEAVSYLYRALANTISGRRWFDAPSLKESIQMVKELLYR
jgi:phosphoribosylaminoimidazole-succinocarboxamide synthase